METLANLSYVIRLYLSNGRETWLAPETTPGWLAQDRTLCLGPLGSHLTFTYWLHDELLELVRGRHQPSDNMRNRGDIILQKSLAGRFSDSIEPVSARVISSGNENNDLTEIG